MRNDDIYGCFSLGTRLSNGLSRLIHFQDSRSTYVDYLNNLEANIYNPFDLNSKDQEATRDKVYCSNIPQVNLLESHLHFSAADGHQHHASLRANARC